MKLFFKLKSLNFIHSFDFFFFNLEIFKYLFKKNSLEK